VRFVGTLYDARRYDESIAQLQKTLELAPNLGYAYAELGQNYAQKGMYREAVTAPAKELSALGTSAQDALAIRWPRRK